VLVLEAEAVELEIRRGARLVGRDHRIPAAGIAGDGVDRDREVGRHDPGLHQRPQQQDGTGRVAAGVGDARGGRDPRRLLRRELRQAIGPVRVHPVRGAGIQQLGRICAQRGGQRRALLGGVVGQAEHHQVHLGHQRLPRLRILAASRVDGADGDMWQQIQPLADLQAGGAGLAVDEHRGDAALGHGSGPSFMWHTDSDLRA
jgi:hypothetical protein